MFVILAGITLNAVIGEDGIIFQAKDTKNMITNETTYDNQQLVALQNEFKDNSVYSGIGIIPGTDTGGSSEGGENGSSGGGSGNTGGGNTNTGGSNNSSGGITEGGTAQDPTIRVLEGEEIAASFYRSDIAVKLSSQDDTCYKKTTYTVTGTATGSGTIGGIAITSGQNVNITEIEIANGGTFVIATDGRWTVKGYTYDKAGRKSEIATGIVVTRDMVNPIANMPTVSSGTQGEASYYRSNVTVRMNGGSDAQAQYKK